MNKEQVLDESGDKSSLVVRLRNFLSPTYQQANRAQTSESAGISRRALFEGVGSGFAAMGLIKIPGVRAAAAEVTASSTINNTQNTESVDTSLLMTQTINSMYPESRFSEQERIEKAKYHFFTLRDTLLKFFEGQTAFPPQMGSELGLPHFLALSQDNLPKFDNLSSLQAPALEYDVAHNLPEYDLYNIEHASKDVGDRFAAIAKIFPLLSTLGKFEIYLSYDYWGAAYREKPVILLHPYDNDAIKIIHEVGHNLEGAYLRPEFLKHANEADYYFYLAEKINSILFVLRIWLDANQKSPVRMLMKNGKPLFEYATSFMIGQAEAETTMKSFFEQPDNAHYLVRAQEIAQSMSRPLDNYTVLNLAWNFWLADSCMGKPVSHFPGQNRDTVILTMIRELDHYFLGPVQKTTGGLPIRLGQVDKSPLGVANYRVNASFLECFAGDPKLTPINLIQGFDQTPFEPIVTSPPSTKRQSRFPKRR
jgi:hypothetical protein